MDGEINIASFLDRFRDNPRPILDAFTVWYMAKATEDPEIWTEELSWKDWLHAMSAFFLEVAADLPMPEPFPPSHQTSTRYIIPVDLMPTSRPPARVEMAAVPKDRLEGEEGEEPPKSLLSRTPNPRNGSPPPPWARVEAERK
jgi:hypothetical protein